MPTTAQINPSTCPERHVGLKNVPKHTPLIASAGLRRLFSPLFMIHEKRREKKLRPPPDSPRVDPVPLRTVQSISNGSFQPQAPHDRHVPARRLRHGLLAHRVRRDRHLQPRPGLGRDVPPGYPLDAFFDITSQNATPVSLYVLALGAMLTQVMDDDGEMTVSEVSEISEIPIRQPTRRSLLPELNGAA